MSKALINLNITTKEELDEIIRQYKEGGKALMLVDDYQQILRNAYKHGHEQYLEDIKKLIEENETLNDRTKPNIDEETLSIVASACMEYFRSKFFEAMQDNGIEI